MRNLPEPAEAQPGNQFGALSGPISRPLFLRRTEAQTFGRRPGSWGRGGCRQREGRMELNVQRGQQPQVPAGRTGAPPVVLGTVGGMGGTEDVAVGSRAGCPGHRQHIPFPASRTICLSSMCPTSCPLHTLLSGFSQRLGGYVGRGSEDVAIPAALGQQYGQFLNKSRLCTAPRTESAGRGGRLSAHQEKGGQQGSEPWRLC